MLWKQIKLKMRKGIDFGNVYQCPKTTIIQAIPFTLADSLGPNTGLHPVFPPKIPIQIHNSTDDLATSIDPKILLVT